MNRSLQFNIFLLTPITLCFLVDLSGFLAALMFIWIAIFLIFFAKRPKTLISPVVFIVVAYVLGFPIPILLPELYPLLWSRVPPDALDYGILWAVRGFGAFALTYILVEYLYKPSRKRLWVDEAYDSSCIQYTLFVLKSIGWLALTAWIVVVVLFGISLVFIESEAVAPDTTTGTQVQILTLLKSLRYPFFFSFLILQFWKQTDSHLHFLFGALLLVTVVDIIVIGSKGIVMRMIISMILSFSFIPQRLSLKQLLAGLLAVGVTSLTFAVITEYRSIMQTEYASGRDVLSFEVQTESFSSALLNSLPLFESDTDRQTQVGHEDILGRFGSGMFSFANLLEFTERQSPYENAWETFLIPLYSISPRALTPEKPEFFHSGRNAREYYGWSYGGIAVSLLGSLYFAWDYAGIILGMALLGGLFASLVKQTRFANIYSLSYAILLVTLLISMLDIGTTFHSIITNFIRVIVILWLLRLLYPIVKWIMPRQISRNKI